MATQTFNHAYAIQSLNEQFKNDEGCKTLREYTEYCAENEPGFFNWLFSCVGNESGIEDYGQGMTEEQKAEYEEFLESLPDVQKYDLYSYYRSVVGDGGWDNAVTEGSRKYKAERKFITVSEIESLNDANEDEDLNYVACKPGTLEEVNIWQ